MSVQAVAGTILAGLSAGGSLWQTGCPSAGWWAVVTILLCVISCCCGFRLAVCLYHLGQQNWLWRVALAAFQREVAVHIRQAAPRPVAPRPRYLPQE